MPTSRPAVGGRGRRARAGSMGPLLVLALASCTKGAPPRDASALEGEGRDALIAEARHAAHGGDHAEARLRYEELLRRDRGDDEARAGLARVDAWDGAYARAERGYREVLSRHPEDDEVRAGLFDVLSWAGRWDAAERVLDEAPAGDRPLLLAKRARLAQVRGDLTGAKKLADRAVVLSEGAPEIRAVRDRITTGSARAAVRAQLFPRGYPDLWGIDLGFTQAFGHLVLAFDTEQGTRPSSAAGGRAYGATYGLGATWLFGYGFSLGAEGAFGAPAAGVPLGRARVTGTAPILPWLGVGAAYTFRRYADGVDTHGASPSLAITIGEALRIDATYWLTYVRAEEGRLVHAFGVSAGRTLLPWLSLRAGYAHGAEAERATAAAFQLLDLTSDGGFAGAEIAPSRWLRLYPLYAFTLRGPRGAERIAIHTLEMGTAIRW
ncbi:tetratricopeptide repeat protein [Polyangium aurulentum]|uniref:tetratricopeptide repeat protein n=1 Tax=Polyangium aurulentum TaxID=2567896 RepID=UPI0010ADCA93|nr:tetratricopeptide repeat protein [Polyangium aurulentum]UQA57762.1 tetratricopeptide repeat protein [Polyangium aurulentum]